MLNFLFFWRKPFDRRTAKPRKRAGLFVKRTRIKPPGLPSESAADPMTPFAPRGGSR